MKDILLITPPFTQLNTPYPATAYLKGFLNKKNIASHAVDLGIEVILELFTIQGLKSIFSCVQSIEQCSYNAQKMYALRQEYFNSIDAVVGFLQGRNQTLAWQICSGDYLPQGSRFDALNDVEWAFGAMGFHDKAKHFCTLYLEDLSDFISECIDPNFGFSRYAERLGRSANSFNQLYASLKNKPTYIDALSTNLLKTKLKQYKPKMLCFSVPFPGNLYSAFRCAQMVKQQFPDVIITMGGGFANTELRNLSDARVFDFFDYITLDDGELPIELLYKSLLSEKPFDNRKLKRTYGLLNNSVYYNDSALELDYKQCDLGVPDYSDLPNNKYISVIEMANPMHSLWSNGRWNKLTMAHGCYWAKCTFCDGSLNYIQHHDALKASEIVDRMEEIMLQTGENGFHFVDEAAPPKLMRDLAIEIIRRKLKLSWWTNIRFEKRFTADLCKLLKQSGCIAVSGGLEVASDRLLKLINKGVSLKQVVQVTNNLTEAGIMVHAYLMYGFPSQSVQETIDSLEMVRQLFENGLIQSGFWHQFALTAHSPVGQSPEKYGIKPHYKPITFANNDVQFSDNTGIIHDEFSYGLKKSIYNFMHDIGFDIPLHEWFSDNRTSFKIPKTKVSKGFVEGFLAEPTNFILKPNGRLLWLGVLPTEKIITKSKKGKSWQILVLTFYTKQSTQIVNFDIEEGKWLLELLRDCILNDEKTMQIEQAKVDFERHLNDFELFWFSKSMQKVKKLGLIII